MELLQNHFKALKTVFWVFFLCSAPVINCHAATWLRGENNQWYYVDEYLPLHYFILETTQPELYVLNAISFPLEALQQQEELSFEIKQQDNYNELWVVSKTEKTFVAKISAAGKAFFEQHRQLKFYLGRKVKYIIKELVDGSFELWDADLNEQIITLSSEGVESFRKTTDSVIMTLEK